MPRTGANAVINPGADTCDMATDAGVVPPNYLDAGLLLDPGDREWRSFRLTSPRAIRIETIGDPEFSDTNLTLYKRCEDGVPSLPLAFNEDRSFEDWTSRIPLQGAMCLRADTYFVDVGSYFNGGTTAPFDLLITDEGPCTLPGIDRYEPDDDPSQAKPLWLNLFGWSHFRHRTIQSRTIDPEGDLDFARFRLLLPTVVRVTAGSSANVDTVIGIADPATGEYVAVNDDTAVGTLGAQIETCLPPGNWLVAVVGRSYPDIFHYKLEGSIRGLCAFESEPNDALASADQLRPHHRRERATIHGQRSLSTSGQDADFFRFRVPRRSGVTLEIGGYDIFRVDTLIELYDAAGTLIEANDDGGQGWMSKIERNLAAGVYFVKVTGSPLEVEPHLPFVYQLNLTLNDPFPLEEEPNDSCGEATGVALGDHLLAGIAPVGDLDRYEVEVGGSTGGGVLLDVTVTSLGDPLVRLYDDPGSCASQIGCDDDSGPGLDPHLQCCVPAQSSYSIEVRDFRDNHAIPFYSFDVKALGACVPSGPCPIAPDQLGCP
jgi:hypothetical protein